MKMVSTIKLVLLHEYHTEYKKRNITRDEKGTFHNDNENISQSIRKT